MKQQTFLVEPGDALPQGKYVSAWRLSDMNKSIYLIVEIDEGTPKPQHEGYRALDDVSLVAEKPARYSRMWWQNLLRGGARS